MLEIGKKLHFHPDKPVSWSLTLQGIFIFIIYIFIYLFVEKVKSSLKTHTLYFIEHKTVFCTEVLTENRVC